MLTLLKPGSIHPQNQAAYATQCPLDLQLLSRVVRKIDVRFALIVTVVILGQFVIEPAVINTPINIPFHVEAHAETQIGN